MLEGINLESFVSTDGEPIVLTVMDIPQSLVGIMSYIRLLEDTDVFDKFILAHKTACKRLIPDYCAVYLGDAGKRQKRGEE